VRQPKYKIPLLGSERAPLPGFRVLRRIDPSAIIRVIMLLRTRPEHKGLGPVEDMAARPLQESRYLTREEYAAAQGADAADIPKVLQFAAEHGLKPEGVNEAARIVHLRGTAAAISKAFSVDLFVYQRAGPRSIQRYRGRTGPIYIPAELEGIVQAVLGLDDHPRPRPNVRRLH
jgi:kumamolisin